MLFSSRLSLGDLIPWCRTLRHQTGAGVSLVKVLHQQAIRGPSGIRPVSYRISEKLQRGESFQAAMQSEAALFPPLMLAMIEVGEETGQLPEIFAALEDYFRTEQQMQRQFRSQSMLPVVQIVFAFFIIALLIIILGMIGEARRTNPPSIFGFTGVSGGLVFLGTCFAGCAVLFFLVRWTTRRAENKATFSSILLRLPMIGSCLTAVIVGRFAFALHLTLNTAMPAAKALRLSFQATGNAAMQQSSNAVIRVVKSGKSISLALSRCKWLPDAFLNMVAVGEAGGRLPEVMQHQADVYREEASRRMKTLARTASFAIWVLYALFMIVAIFQIANVYLSKLGV